MGGESARCTHAAVRTQAPHACVTMRGMVPGSRHSGDTRLRALATVEHAA
ncbi:hypothetical protein XHC_4282 [Xanthomonas hortorum pv. carotae str. M081]|nr:hypothetical protein XHC_4282 [Xanthomonas hortorum pv. carotae str. M081]